MLEITTENFEAEVLKSDKPVLLKFYLQSGCAFCDRYAPAFAAFAEAHPEIKCVAAGKESIKSPQTELEARLGVERYPTTVSFVAGKSVRKETGALDEAKLLAMTKTLSNMGDAELVGVKLDLDVAAAQKRRELYGIEVSLAEVQAELSSRAVRQAAAAAAAPVAPVAPAAPEAAKPAPKPKPPAAPAPEGDPNEGGCDGCQ